MGGRRPSFPGDAAARPADVRPVDSTPFTGRRPPPPRAAAVHRAVLSLSHRLPARSLAQQGSVLSKIYANLINQSINQSIFIVKTLLTERSGVTDKH